jgi:hypothetical protein
MVPVSCTTPVSASDIWLNTFSTSISVQLIVQMCTDVCNVLSLFSLSLFFFRLLLSISSHEDTSLLQQLQCAVLARCRFKSAFIEWLQHDDDVISRKVVNL